MQNKSIQKRPTLPPTKLLLVVLLFSLLEAPGLFAQVDWKLDLRARWEVNEAPSPSPALDSSFDFGHARVRLGLDWQNASGRWKLHGVLQGAGTFGLQDDASFGIGRVYYGVNGESDPSHAGLVELTLGYHAEGLSLVFGRQSWKGGIETLTGVGYLDGVKKKRLAERLIGTWDWVNVGRRFDGLSLKYDAERLHLAGYAFRPTAGGVNYEDAFETLDDLELASLIVTSKYGALLPRGEIRFGVVDSDDRRPGAVAASGGAIDLRTWTASVLFGDDRGDVLLWYALQEGDWGPREHDADAFFAEIGRKFGKISGRIGIAEASGDPDPVSGDHESFFNLLPTNHKWYGAMDFSAFSNLRNLYVDLSFPIGKVNVGVGLHRFELVETADAWYGGSGAFNEGALGYAARRVAGGFDDDALGEEIDLTFGVGLPHDLKLAFGASWFSGDGAASRILADDDEGSWFFIQLAWSR